MTSSPIKDNKLRQRILETMQEYNIDPHMCNDNSCVASNLHIQGIDALLTVIIDSLPEYKPADEHDEGSNYRARLEGYNNAVWDIKESLTNAKSNKGVNHE